MLHCPNCKIQLSKWQALRGGWPSKIKCSGCGIVLRSKMKLSHNLLWQVVMQVIFWATLIYMLRFGLVISLVTASAVSVVTTIPFLKGMYFEPLQK